MTDGTGMTCFWEGRRTLVTGHTGFKGSWLIHLLRSAQARVFGFSLPPSGSPSLFNLAIDQEDCTSCFGDIRSRDLLASFVDEVDPEVVIHLAAQPIVIESFRNPLETFDVNFGGTLNLLESLRGRTSLRSVVVVTSDKVYAQASSRAPHIESDRLGGHDPYSSSKAACELLVDSYAKSFFNLEGVGVSTARAGNVIGGGDWAPHRLIPDLVRAYEGKRSLPIRHPNHVRPWQHVLDPLSGYLLLAEHLAGNDPASSAYNFGPESASAVPVSEIVRRFEDWAGESFVVLEPAGEGFPENEFLSLDSSRAVADLGFNPRWGLDQALDKTFAWYSKFRQGHSARALCIDDVNAFSAG